MNFEKYTDRARGFVQSAQVLALREGHQQFAPEHLLKVLLDDPEGLAAGLIDRSGGNSRAGAAGGRGDARQAAESVRRRRRAGLSRSGAGARVRRRREGRREGRRQLRHGRAAAAGAGDREGQRGRQDFGQGRRHAAESQRRDRGAAQGPHRGFRVRRERLRRAEEICPRSHAGRARRQARSGHRPRRGNPPHHPGALAPHQEQSGADRRARRRQDRDRRGSGAAHRQRRRAGEPAGQEAARARPRRHDRRRQISRRVRGAAESRAAGGDVVERRHHPVHRRDAHAGRRRQGRRRDGCLQSAQAGAGARRAALHRRHHARRIQEARREGRGARAPLPAGLRQRALGRGHDLDPARPEGQIRAAPRRAHRRFRDRRRGDAVQPLHHRPLPARQGHRPRRRGGGAAEDAGRFQAGRARLDRPRNRAAEDRAGGAEEGKRSGLEGPAEESRSRTEDAREAVGRHHQPLEVGKGKALGSAEAQDRARPVARRARQCAAQGRIPARRRTGLWPHSRAGKEAEGRRGLRRQAWRHGRGDRDRRSRGAGRLALDRRAGRQDAGRREGKAAAHGRRAGQARHRPEGSRAGGLDRGAARARRPAGPAPADRLVHVPGPDRRRQDRAHQGARPNICSTTRTRSSASTCRNTWRSIRWRG